VCFIFRSFFPHALHYTTVADQKASLRADDMSVTVAAGIRLFDDQLKGKMKDDSMYKIIYQHSLIKRLCNLQFLSPD